MLVTGTVLPYLSSYMQATNFAFFDDSVEIDSSRFNESYAGKDVYINLLKSENGSIMLTDVVFSSDGTKVFILDRYAAKGILSLSLNTPYEITPDDVDFSSYWAIPDDVDTSVKMSLFKVNDYLFLGDDAGKIIRLSGATNFDVSDIVNDGVTDTSGGNTSRNGFSLSADGSKFFFMLGDEIRQVALSTPFDLASGDFNSTSLVYSIDGAVLPNSNFCFHPDGKYAFFVGDAGIMNILEMDTPFDFSTVSKEYRADDSTNGGNIATQIENISFLPSNNGYVLNGYSYGYGLKYRFKYKPLAVVEIAEYLTPIILNGHSAIAFNHFGYSTPFSVTAIRDGEIKSFVCKVKIKDPDGNPYFIAFSGTAANTYLADIYIQNPTVSTNDEIEIDTFSFIFNGQT